MPFVKFRFTSKTGQTAGLVITADRFHRTSVADLSRMFPTSEYRHMARLERSPEYLTWADAFAHDFNAE